VIAWLVGYGLLFGYIVAGCWWLDRRDARPAAASTQPPSPQAEVQDCERCEGTGRLVASRAGGNPATYDCPNCKGTGKQSPAELVEKTARFLFDGSKVDPEHWDRITPRQKDWLRKEARELLAIVTPLIHLEVKERLSRESYRLKREARAERQASAYKGGDKENEGAARAYEAAADSLDAILASLAPVSSEPEASK
jgi:hypothetical protein